MKPVLYNGNETDFTGNGIAVLSEALSCEAREVRNGEFELTLEYPVDGPWFKEIIEQRILRAKPNDKDDLHNFRIYNVTKGSNGESVIAQAATKTNDLGGNLVKRLQVTDVTAQAALTAMKGSLVEPTIYNFVSDITTKGTTLWEMRNPLNCIVGEEGSLVDIWGGEVKRTDTTIYLYSRRGIDKVTRIRPRKGMTGFSMKTSTASVVTRIQPFAAYRDEENDKDVTVIGTIVESPRKGDYAFSKILPVQYTENADGTPITTVAQLDALAKNYFTEHPTIDKPKVEVSADLIALADTTYYDKFKKLETIGLTDTIEVYVPKYGIDVELKITELVYNVLTEQVISLKAGDTSSTFYESNKYEYGYEVNQLKKYIYTVENGLRNYVQISANGKNTIFRGYTEPDKSISHEGDLWFKELGNGEQEIWIFDGTYWQPVVTAGINEELAAKLAEAQEAIDAAEKSLADTQAELANLSQATTAAQAAADQALAAGNDAKAKVEQAQEDIANLDSQVQDVVIDVGSALQNAATAQQKATDALTSATSAMDKAAAVEATTQELEVTVDGFTGRMTSIETANQQTVQKINEVTVTVDGMTQTLATVETTANSALSKTNTLSTDVDSMNLTLTSVKNWQNDFYIGARNWVSESESPKFRAYQGASITYTTVSVPEWNATNAVRHVVTSGTGTICGTLPGNIITYVKDNTDYVHSMYVKNNGTVRVGFSNNLSKTDYVEPGETKRIVMKARHNVNVAAMQFVLYRPVNTDNLDFTIWRAQIEEGVALSDWSPAPEDKAQTSKVNAISVTVDGLTQTIGTTTTTATTALNKVNSLETTVDGLNLSISSIKTQVDNIPTNERNLLKNSSFWWDYTDWGVSNLANGIKVTFDTDAVDGSHFMRYEKSIVTSTRTTIGTASTQGLVGSVKSGTTYSFGLWYYVESVTDPGTSNNVFMRLAGTNAAGASVYKDSPLAQFDFSRTGEWIWLTATGVATAGLESITTATFTIAFGQSTIVKLRIKEAIFVEGNAIYAWNPAPEDLASASALTNLAVTTNGLMLDVINVSNTANSALTKATQVEITANGLTSTVSEMNTTAVNMDWKSKIAGALQLTADPTFLKGANNLIPYNNTAGGNVTLTRQNVPLTSGGTQPTGSDYRMMIKTIGAASPGLGGFYYRIDARVNAKFIIRFTANIPAGRTLYHANNPIGTGGEVRWLTPRQGTGTWTEYAYLVECGTGGSFSTFGFQYIQSIAGDNYTPENSFTWYVAKFEVFDITNSSQSQITQLSDEIDLRVKTGEVINAINISPSGTLISGNKLSITAQTYIDNAVIKTAHIEDLSVTGAKIADLAVTTVKIGLAAINTARIADLAVTAAKIANATITNAEIAKATILAANIANATITDAQIGSLNASKITAGTLNAANVSIINLNVANLVGDKTNFVQSAWNNISSSVTIDAYGMNVSRGDGSISTKFIGDGIQIWGGGAWQGSLSYATGPNIALWAKKTADLTLGYQGGNTADNIYYTALKISGDTGRIDIYNDLYVNNKALMGVLYITGGDTYFTGAYRIRVDATGRIENNFYRRANGSRTMELIDTSFGGSVTGVGWAHSNGSSGIMFASDGGVLVKRNGGTWTQI